MDLYEVLEKRRTYRDFTDEKVSDGILNRVISAAFKAPTNDHLRQLEFVVVRGKEEIAKVIAPLAKNMAAFKELVAEVDESGDKDKMEMFEKALPRQQLKPAEQSSLNYFASAWCALENMLLAATAEGLGAAFHIPVADEADRIKEIVGTPADYEFICLLSIGYPAPNAFLPRQKAININDRIHQGRW